MEECICPGCGDHLTDSDEIDYCEANGRCFDCRDEIHDMFDSVFDELRGDGERPW